MLYAFPWVIVGLLLLGIFKFVGQDFKKHSSQQIDFRNVYFGTVGWSKGEQPYDPQVTLREMNEGDETSRNAPIDKGAGNAVYPPSCYPVILPLTLLQWRMAHLFELALSVIVYLLFLWRIRLYLTGRRYLYFCAFALAFAPFHGAFEASNISALVTSMICLAVFNLEEYPISSGLLLGISSAMKPQLAALFILHLLLCKRWKPFWTAAGAATASFLTGIAWMKLHHLEWLTPYRHILSIQMMPLLNNENGIVQNGQVNFTLFNLQPLGYLLTRSIPLAILLGWVTFTLLFVLYALYMLKSHRVGGRVSETALWGLVALLTFFPIYQRYYNAVLLLIVFVWALEAWPHLLAKVFVVSGTLFLPPLSKLPSIARAMEMLVGVGYHGAWRDMGSGLLRPGVTDWHLSPFEMLAFSLPFLFVIFATCALLVTLWAPRLTARTVS